ncbi:microtubule-associated protein 10 [Anolis carolinensis]|uniref:microtubule-associated protein 10 n=1 Tax=Anolis carolinensis TaxID=28377 RepID=UPI002F2B1F4B
MEGGNGARGVACGENLFSLELLVESARVEPWLLPGPSPASSSASACSWGPHRPAVALRLLDFPTLLVRAPQAALPGPVVPFGRGKSCLFRLRPESLRELLRRSPLYALLLALPPSAPGPARLLGSCSVSLADAAEELLRLPPGPSGGRGGRFPLRDLMGDAVGELALSYRLSNLGPCPRGHLGQGAAPQKEPEGEPCRPTSPGKRQPSLERIPEADEEQDLAPEPFSLGSSSSGHAELPSDRHADTGASSPTGAHTNSPTGPRTKSPTGPRSKSPTGLRSKSHTKAQSKSPTGIRRNSPTRTRHSRPHSKSHTELSVVEADNEPDIEANVFCPPPMYYTRPSASPGPLPQSTSSIIMTVAAAQESFPDEVAAFPSAVPLVKEEPVREAAPETLTGGGPEQLRQNLNQLPLLNALLVELSLLNSPSLEPQLSSVHPQLAWLYQKKEVTETPAPCAKTVCPWAKTVCPCCEEKKSAHRRERGRSISPKLKRNRIDHLKCVSPSLLVPRPRKTSPKMAYAERLCTEKNNAKENSPPRRKLTYGLTNTLRLRLQRCNPTMLKIHEKREHRRKKQGELVEKKGKTSSGKGKIHHGSPEVHPKSSVDFDEKSIPDQKAQINENVETLIQNSVNQDRPSAEEGAVIVKNSEDGKQKVSCETIGSPCKENGLKVHLPKVFLQESEGLENKIDTDVEKSIEHNSDISSIQNDSQSNKLENSHEFKNSDDIQMNSGHTAYSEDFTSADISGPGLESQESSLDSLMVSRDEDHSVMDSDSKISGKTHTAESISPPLPVPSASPIQSFKKMHGLKSNTKSTGVLFNKLLDESSPPETVKEEIVSQNLVEERGSRQILQNKEVSSDLNSNITNSQSVEKSSSLRTSQVSSYLPSNVSELDLSGLEESNASEKENEGFAMLNITNQCKHISELIVNKLPGYTM